jgi:hypothetical protein
VNTVSFEKRAQPIDTGSFSETQFLNPNKQFSPEQSGGANLAGSAGTDAVTAFIVPKFQGPSGEGANRNYVARKEGN